MLSFYVRLEVNPFPAFPNQLLAAALSLSLSRCRTSTATRPGALAPNASKKLHLIQCLWLVVLACSLFSWLTAQHLSEIAATCGQSFVA